MPHDAKACLHDVLRAAELILKFSADRKAEDLSTDDYFRAAVEREFQIVGEALVRLKGVDKDLFDQVPENRKIVAFRNIIVHNYDNIDLSIVWGAIEAAVPALKSVVENLLNSLPYSPP